MFQVYKIVLWGPRNHSTPPYSINFDECGACKVTYNKNEVNLELVFIGELWSAKCRLALFTDLMFA